MHRQDRPEGEWEKSLPCASGCLGTFQVVGSGAVTEDSKRQTYAATETGRRSTRKRQADNSSPGQERRHSFLSPVPKPQLEGPKEMVCFFLVVLWACFSLLPCSAYVFSIWSFSLYLIY